MLWQKENQLDFGSLSIGDVDINNQINSNDVKFLLNNWLAAKRAADLDQNQKVNGLDYSWIKVNFNKIGD